MRRYVSGGSDFPKFDIPYYFGKEDEAMPSHPLVQFRSARASSAIIIVPGGLLNLVKSGLYGGFT